MFPFYTPCKQEKILDFLVFLGGIKWKHRPKMGQSSKKKYGINEFKVNIEDTKTTTDLAQESVLSTHFTSIFHYDTPRKGQKIHDDSRRLLAKSLWK